MSSLANGSGNAIGGDTGEQITTVIRPNKGVGRLGLPQVLEYSYLLKYFVLRDVRARYRPTLLGYSWILLRPALLCIVYAAVFAGLLGVRAPEVPMPLFIFFGVSMYLFMSTALTTTANSLASAAGIMSKVYFPRLITPLAALVGNLVDLLAAFVIVALLMLFYGIVPGSEVAFFPLYAAGFVILAFAIGLVLAAKSIERRDVMLFLPIAMRVLIYCMPAVYPITVIPQQYLTYYYLNPFAVILQGMRWSLMGGQVVPLWATALAASVTVLILIYGLLTFNRVERTMVDRL